MKNILCLFILILLSGCNKKYIIMPNVKGKIYSKVNNKPISNVRIFVSKYAINNMDTIRTDHNGSFLYNGFFVDNYSDVRSMSTMVQHVFILKSDQAYKYINVKKYYNKDDYNKRDTIDLGIIYFENLKSVKKDSIPK
ncbi:hypothetical protein SD427_04780 [Chryseobacterium sp. JJR-5R]|uniref:hypothetical protein n=1 Tax=Chryseobacterium sp. JJR-5R TaxID=3093923 RepID=UPI002A74F1F9|nr:hypothetical protein [Chryseobacterium sp. JJR-5R]WPO83653.1 hypothetical protein SD427_04780 [Chryseobacterium sp. JJR-5R]